MAKMLSFDDNCGYKQNASNQFRKGVSLSMAIARSKS